MNSIDIVRAWKDAAYCDSLSAAERAALPENPAGAIVLTDEELDLVVGAGTSYPGFPCPDITDPKTTCDMTKKDRDYFCGGPPPIGTPTPRPTSSVVISSIGLLGR